MPILARLRARATRYGDRLRAARVLKAPGARLGARSHVRTIGDGTLHVGDGVVIHEGAAMAVFGRLTIGDGTSVGDHVHVNVKEAVSIGARCQLSWRVTITDTDFHTIKEVDGSAGPMTAPVAIGEHVLIGAGVTILKGVTIGDGAVIGAGSVVTRDIPAGTLAAGNPARVIREISDWR